MSFYTFSATFKRTTDSTSSKPCSQDPKCSLEVISNGISSRTTATWRTSDQRVAFHLGDRTCESADLIDEATWNRIVAQGRVFLGAENVGSLFAMGTAQPVRGLTIVSDKYQQNLEGLLILTLPSLGQSTDISRVLPKVSVEPAPIGGEQSRLCNFTATMLNQTRLELMWSISHTGSSNDPDVRVVIEGSFLVPKESTIPKECAEDADVLDISTNARLSKIYVHCKPGRRAGVVLTTHCAQTVTHIAVYSGIKAPMGVLSLG